MYFQQITVVFSYEQRKKFKQLMNYYRPEKELTRQKNQAEIFKHTLLSYLISVKTEISLKNQVVQDIKDLLKEKKFLTESREVSLQKQHREVSSRIKALKEYIKQKQSDSDSYNLYVTYLSQLRDLKQQNLGQFETNLNKFSSLNYQEKQNIRFLAKKLIRSNQAEQKVKSHQEVSQFLADILRFGFNREILTLSAIQDKQLQLKCRALVEKVQNNFVEIQPNLRYGENSLNNFIEKLTNRVYTRQQVGRILQKLPQKLQTMFQPLFSEIYALRQGSSQKARPYQYFKSGHYDPQIKKAEEESLKQLVTDFGLANSKVDKLQAEIAKIRWFLKVVTELSPNPKQKSNHSQIQKYLQNYQNEEMKFNLLKVYQKFNNYGYKQPIHKTFKEARENELLTEKQSKRISKLQQELSRYKEYIKQLQQHKAESLAQRIQFLEEIEHHKDIVVQRNKTIDQLSATLNTLEGIEQEKTELENVIRIVQERSEQQAININKYIQNNQQLNQQLNLCIRQKAQLQQQIKTLKEELQLKSEQAELKSKKEEFRSRQDLQLQSKRSQFQLQRQVLENQISRLNSQIAELKESNQDLKSRIDEMADLQTEVQNLTMQNDVLTEKLQQFIKAKSSISQKTILLDEEKQTLLSEIALLKREIEVLAANQYQTKGREEYCHREIEDLKYQFQQFGLKYNQLLKEYELKQADLEQYKKQNQSLMGEIQRMANMISERSNITKISEQTRQNYEILEKELQQSKKLNQLIKAEYLSFKQQSKNAFKSKLQDEISVYKANEEKLKENYRKLYDHFVSLKERLASLKKQNQQLRQQKVGQASKQLSSLKYLAQRSQLQQKYKDIVQRHQTFKTLSQREMVKKQEQIAHLKLQLIQTERYNQSNSSDLHQQQLKKEKLEYLESMISELQQDNSKLKMEVQRKQQEILILRMQQLK